MSYQPYPAATATVNNVGSASVSTINIPANTFRSANGVRIRFVSGSGNYMVVTVGTEVTPATDPTNTGVGGSVIMKGEALIIEVNKAATVKAIADTGTDNKIHVELCIFRPGYA